MAWHARHVHRTPGEVRVQIRFRRTDLLYRHDRPLRDPYADAKRRAARAGENAGLFALEVPGLPISTTNGNVVGPTLLDMLDRRVWRVSDLPAPTQEALRARLGPDDPWPTSVAAWSARDLDTLWPAPGRTQRPPREPDDEDPREPDHPFQAGLASGGRPLAEPPPSDEWMPITKLSTCLVGEYVYRLAAGVFGSVEDAYTQIAEAAAAAWTADRARALQLWDRIKAAPGAVLVEDRSVVALRPNCSVSQEVERGIMREACRWLGVDPDLDLGRPRGRPRSPDKNADQGDVIRVVLSSDGTVTGAFLVDFEGIRAGTELHALSLATIVSVLGALRLRKLQTDVELLEAWLDAAVAEWRERVVDEDVRSTSSSTPDPYEVLGVARDAAMDDVTRAFRTLMKAVHPDTSGGPSEWLSRAVIEAYKTIRVSRGGARAGDAP